MVNHLRKKKLLRQIAGRERLRRMLALPAAEMLAPFFAGGDTRNAGAVFGHDIFEKYRNFLSLLPVNIRLSPRERDWPELKFLLPYFFLNSDSAPNTIIKSVMREIVHYKTIVQKETAFSPLNLRQLQFYLLNQSLPPARTDRPVALADRPGQISFPAASLLQAANDREESRKTFLLHTSPLAVQIFEKFPETAAIPGVSEQKQDTVPDWPDPSLASEKSRLTYGMPTSPSIAEKPPVRASQPILPARGKEMPGGLPAENLAGNAGTKLAGKPAAILSQQSPLRNLSRNAFSDLAPANIMARHQAGLKRRQAFIPFRGAAANLVNIEDRQQQNLPVRKSRSNTFFPAPEEKPYSGGDMPGLAYNAPARDGGINKGPELQHLAPSTLPPAANAPAEETFTAEPGYSRQSIQLARPADLAQLPATSSVSGQEINRLAEEVYTIIEKKLRVESERRGIFF